MISVNYSFTVPDEGRCSDGPFLRQFLVHDLAPALFSVRWHTVRETEWKCGTQGGTMKVPYAKKWHNETDNLRKIVLDCDLVEELKWGKPCFTYQKKNV